MIRMYFALPAAVLLTVVVLLAPLSIHADSVSLPAAADTTLVEVAPDANMGSATFFNAGTAGSNGKRNRAVIQFDLAGSIPAGSIITEAVLLLDVIRQPNGSFESVPFVIHRVLQAWNEGGQVPFGSPGLGAPAMPGETTWNDRFAGATAWAAPGGQPGIDFVGAVSGSALSVGAGDQVVFSSTPQLVADLQLWVDQPAGNYGWMIFTESEEPTKSARSFASRESEFPPTLIVQFTPVPEPSTTALAGCCLIVLLAARFCHRLVRQKAS